MQDHKGKNKGTKVPGMGTDSDATNWLCDPEKVT